MKLSACPVNLRTVAARLGVCLAVVLTGASSWAQVVEPDASAPASAPQATPRLRRVPKLSNSSDAQRSMDLNNEQAGGKVMPQVRIPIGKNAGPPVFEKRRATTANAAAASAAGGSIDDRAARCESETDAAARSACRGRASRQP